MKNMILLVTSFAAFLIHVRSQEDLPATWQEHWFEHNQLLSLHAFDDNVALYYDSDMDTAITWPLEMSSKIWSYVKATYGDFGGQQRLFVILHANKYGGGHPSTFFDGSHDYRNVIDIGQTGSWTEPIGWNLAVITHEISHIVEGASKGVHNSPAFPIWHDSKWAEIFIYDVYHQLGFTEQEIAFLNDMATASDDFPREGTQWFNNWFYPIYNEHGETAVLNRYFDLLAANFPKTPLDDMYFQYDRDLNLGEFIHFWSGAAQANLKDLALNAFGDKDEHGGDWIVQFEQAQRDFLGITY